MTEKIPKEELISFAQTNFGPDWEEAYNDLRYFLGVLYWGHNYSL